MTSTPLTALLLLLLPYLIRSLQTRTSYLRPWDQPNVVLGQTKEFRDANAKSYRVSVDWMANNHNDPTNNDDHRLIQLPLLPRESLASALWPSALAGAILCRSPSFQAIAKNKTVHEVGAGLGLAGMSLAEEAAQVELSDNDKLVLESLEELFSDDLNQAEEIAKIRTRYLDWRDVHEEDVSLPPADIVLGTDVAYYFFLLRPLMDTIQALRESKEESIAMIVGQSNREMQWSLYHNIRDGGYNQRTDKHETPWPGSVTMLLYNLEVEEWIDHDEEAPAVVDHVAPIGCLVHEAGSSTNSIRFSEHDYISTDKDESEMMMTF